MTAEEHNRTLATLHFIYGAMHGLTLIGLLLLVVVIEFATPAAGTLSTFWIAIAVVVFVILFLVAGLVPVVVGFGFRNRSRWAKPLGLALAVVSLINIPIGTALGIYTFKFFRSEGGVKLYGGKTSTTPDSELKDATRGVEPLMNWTNRSKS